MEVNAWRMVAKTKRRVMPKQSDDFTAVAS